MQENPLELTEGSVAPDFAMRDKHGKSNKLSDLHGKRDVVVYFYPEDFTPGCFCGTTRSEIFRIEIDYNISFTMKIGQLVRLSMLVPHCKVWCNASFRKLERISLHSG